MITITITFTATINSFSYHFNLKIIKNVFPKCRFNGTYVYTRTFSLVKPVLTSPCPVPSLNCRWLAGMTPNDPISRDTSIE